jgi:hypothetical protein
MKGCFQPVGCGHEHAVQLLSAMVLPKPGQDLGGQQSDRVWQVTSLMLLIPAQMLQRASTGQEVEPGAESRVFCVHASPGRDL